MKQINLVALKLQESLTSNHLIKNFWTCLAKHQNQLWSITGMQLVSHCTYRYISADTEASWGLWTISERSIALTHCGEDQTSLERNSPSKDNHTILSLSLPGRFTAVWHSTYLCYLRVKENVAECFSHWKMSEDLAVREIWITLGLRFRHWIHQIVVYYCKCKTSLLL